MKEECEGCKIEMEECYRLQQAGFDSGLDWDSTGKHCFVFAFDEEGELVVW